MRRGLLGAIALALAFPGAHGGRGDAAPDEHSPMVGLEFLRMRAVFRERPELARSDELRDTLELVAWDRMP